MMAPKYMRMTQITAVMEEASSTLDEPLDLISVNGSRARVVAGRTRLVVQCDLVSSVDDRGNPVLGSDRWETRIVSSSRALLPGIFATTLLRLFRV